MDSLPRFLPAFVLGVSLSFRGLGLAARLQLAEGVCVGGLSTLEEFLARVRSSFGSPRPDINVLKARRVGLVLLDSPS